LCNPIFCIMWYIVIVSKHISASTWIRFVRGVDWFVGRKFLDYIKVYWCIWNVCECGSKLCPKLSCNIGNLLELSFVLYKIATVLWSECDIFVCSLCTGNWCIFCLFVMCANIDITWNDVSPVDCHIVVSVWRIVHVIKSQCMHQLMYNISVKQAFVTLEVQFLALWVIENLWLTVSRQDRHFVTTRSLIVSCISAEATTNNQTWWCQ